ncbi:MAG: hypothetical protein J5821_00205 [Alphaproteobacteria bacterium]|nr:hypothetical protein [Alphaproteobacteria bacterium]
MRALVLALFTIFFYSNADFSTDSIKSWFNKMYYKGSSKFEVELDKLKTSAAGKKVEDFLDETEDIWKESRRGTISSEFLEARANFMGCTAKLNQELEADIRSLGQLENIQYHDRVVIYKDGQHYVKELEECLANKIKNFANAKAMKKAADDYMDNILNILTDELIYSYVDDLRESHKAFNKAFEKLEKEVKNSR